MHDEPRDKLRELIVEYGRSLCDDPRRCEALLKDHCGQYKREIFALVSALKNRVAEDLLKAPAGMPPSMALARIGNRLEDELAMTPEAAQWAVESWAFALGVIAQPLPLAKPAPVVSSPPPTAPIAQPTSSTALSGAATTLLGGRYRDHGDGTVTDVTTGLQWMRCSLGQEWNSATCSGEAGKYTWDGAFKAAKTINRQGGYAGYRKWRLPTKDELLTLVYCSSGKPQAWNDTGRCCEGKYERPTINHVAFPNTPSSYVWSSSPNATYSNYAWIVSFGSGYTYYSNRSFSNHVRLVRDSFSMHTPPSQASKVQSSNSIKLIPSNPSPISQKAVSPPPSSTSENLLKRRYRMHDNGTVTDIQTGLQWMCCLLGQEWNVNSCVGKAKTYTFDEAFDEVKKLNVNGGYVGYRDWRLPMKDELLTLVYCSGGRPKFWNDTGGACQGDYARPAIYEPAFPNTPDSNVWSSSPNPDFHNGAWFVYFGCGDVSYSYRHFRLHVRLVRG